MFRKIFLILATAASTLVSAQTPPVIEERLYLEFQSQALHSPLQRTGAFTPFEQKLQVDAIWDLAHEGHVEALDALEDNRTSHYALAERLRIGLLRLRLRVARTLNDQLVQDLSAHLLSPAADRRIIYLIAADAKLLRRAGHDDLVEQARAHREDFRDITDEPVVPTPQAAGIASSLFSYTPDLRNWREGSYTRAVHMYMFCREDRRFPCLLAMRNPRGVPVRNPDGSLWTQPSLGSSKHGFPSHQRNGNTPEGILTMDSVMPSADQKETFGKYRRVNLNFIPRSPEEGVLKALLPPSTRREEWWRPSVIARDIGRNLLRIHGTGKINPDPLTPFFPFLQTLGCIAQRENTYAGRTYRDQRQLLDTIMGALDLAPIYQNETQVKGILYLINIDSKNEAVTAADLAAIGIR